MTVGSLKRKGLKDFVPEGLNKIEKKVKVTTNKWNGKPYSKKYYEILEVRKKLPAWEAKE